MADVGYKKPPLETQFAKGKSGNPKGRPKGAKNLRTVLNQELQSKVIVHENGRSQKISMQEAMMKQLVQKAARGDLRAIFGLIGMSIKIDPDQAKATQNQPLTKFELALLEDLMQTMRTEEKSHGTK